QTQTLARYGIVLDTTATAQEQFNELLKIGAANFALAEAEAQTTAGRLTQLKNALGDLGESLGALILGLDGGGANIKDITDAIQKLTKQINDMDPATRAMIQDFIKWGVVLVATTALLSPVARALSSILGLVGRLGAIRSIGIAISLIGAAKVLEMISKIKAWRAEEKRSNTEARRTAQTREVNALEFAAEQAGATEEDVKAQKDKAIKKRTDMLRGLGDSIHAEDQKIYDYLDKKYGAGSGMYNLRRAQYEHGAKTFEPEIESRRKNLEGLRQQEKQVRASLAGLQGADIAKIMADTKATRDKATAAELERLGLTGPDWAPSRDSLGPLVGRAVGPLGPLVGGDVGGGARTLARSRHPLGPLVGRAVGPLGPLVGGVIGGGLPAFFGGGGKAQPRQPRTASVPKPFAGFRNIESLSDISALRRGVGRRIAEDADKERNRLLERIERNTRNIGTVG
ncbi:MAG TPA: hypothetical protein VM238_16435, partial [Phycisphaerae bacterium]|nr:hypothetical protein [Phycisphaerae bacterium]